MAAPLLLPWLPGKSFSIKGTVTGVLWCILWYFAGKGATWSLPATIGAFLALPAVSAFYALNFTGCSTYTSRTGVKREMGRALPLMEEPLPWVSCCLWQVDLFNPIINRLL